MKRAEDGLPVVGSNSKELGVRVPPNPSPDVDLDRNMQVITNGKGMSVAEHWRYMLGHFVPNNLTCYKFGTGIFASAPLNDELVVVTKQHDHHAGSVVPSESVPIQQFQAALARTRPQWQPDET